MEDKKKHLIELLCSDFGKTQLGRILERNHDIQAIIKKNPECIPEKFSETYCAGICAANESKAGLTYAEALKVQGLYLRASIALMDLVEYINQHEEASKALAEQSTDKLPRW